MKVYDDKISIGRGCSRIEISKEGWTDGEVVTPHGIVSIYAQGSDKYQHYTRLDFGCSGKLYIRSFHYKRYTPRGIVTKAKQFAKEISEKCSTPFLLTPSLIH